jgi:hypothetical protein
MNKFEYNNIVQIVVYTAAVHHLFVNCPPAGKQSVFGRFCGRKEHEFSFFLPADRNNSYCYKKAIEHYIIIIIVTVTKSYSVYIKYYSKQGEKIMVLVRILMSKSGFKYIFGCPELFPVPRVVSVSCQHILKKLNFLHCVR